MESSDFHKLLPIQLRTWQHDNTERAQGGCITTMGVYTGRRRHSAKTNAKLQISLHVGRTLRQVPRVCSFVEIVPLPCT